MMLSKYFSLEEMTRSDVATRKNIDNQPDADVLENLKMLCSRLDRLRDVLSVPIHVSSGYRSPKVNAGIGGSKNSAHMSGLAVDFTAPAYAPVSDTFALVRTHMIGYDFDQLIIEYDRWIHLGYSEGKGRQQVLRITYQGKEVLA